MVLGSTKFRNREQAGGRDIEPGESWAVYAEQLGFARLTPVEVGAGAQDACACAVAHPSDRMTDCVELLVRQK